MTDRKQRVTRGETDSEGLDRYDRKKDGESIKAIKRDSRRRK